MRPRYSPLEYKNITYIVGDIDYVDLYELSHKNIWQFGKLVLIGPAVDDQPSAGRRTTAALTHYHWCGKQSLSNILLTRK